MKNESFREGAFGLYQPSYSINSFIFLKGVSKISYPLAERNLVFLNGTHAGLLMKCYPVNKYIYDRDLGGFSKWISAKFLILRGNFLSSLLKQTHEKCSSFFAIYQFNRFRSRWRHGAAAPSALLERHPAIQAPGQHSATSPTCYFVRRQFLL